MSNPQKSSDCEMQESRIGNLTYRLSRGIGYRNLLTEVDVVVDDTGTQIRLPFGSRNRVSEVTGPTPVTEGIGAN